MTRTNFDGDGNSQITLDIKKNKDNATSVNVEALYRIQVSDFISVTLGVYMMTNMDRNKENGTTLVGVWRTSFTF
nr:carbohydrate porin [Microcoleus asticus]